MNTERMKALVEVGRALEVVRIALEVPLQLIALFLRHQRVNLLEVLAQVDRLAVDLELFLGAATLFLGARCASRSASALRRKRFFRYEKTVEALAEGALFAGTLGTQRAQCGANRSAIFKTGQLQRAHAVDRLAESDAQS